MEKNAIIRRGEPKDIEGVYALIVELAIFEEAPDEVDIRPEDLMKDAFGEHPLFQFIVAEFDGKIIGTAIYYFRYSTWKGKCIFLEDLVVAEKHRRRGVGKLLLDEMVSISKDEGARRLMWQVLDWNETAIKFYKKYDAIIEPEWLNCKLVDSQF